LESGVVVAGRGAGKAGEVLQFSLKLLQRPGRESLDIRKSRIRGAGVAVFAFIFALIISAGIQNVPAG